MDIGKSPEVFRGKIRIPIPLLLPWKQVPNPLGLSYAPWLLQ